MNKFNIKLVVLILLSSSSSYALEQKNVEILSHKSWVTGTSSNSFAISGHIEYVPSFCMMSSTIATAYSASGYVNSNVYTTGYHSFRIENSSSQSQRYTVDLKLCTNNNCFHDQTSMNVGKNGYYSSSANSSLTCSFGYAGDYTLEARTEITGADSSVTRGTANIHISR